MIRTNQGGGMLHDVFKTKNIHFTEWLETQGNTKYEDNAFVLSDSFDEVARSCGLLRMTRR